MSFNLQKYLMENNLTLISNKRLRESDEEPSDEEIKKNDKSAKELDKNKKDLELLQGKLKDIIFKYTKDTPQGKVLTNVTAYKKAVGDLPKKIKDLKKKIDSVENPSSEENEED
jgi:uncharacterized membrane protein